MLELGPPRCFRAFRTEPVPDPGVEFDELIDGRQNLFRSVGCVCGGGLFKVHGHVFRQTYASGAYEEVLYGPLRLDCTSCGRQEASFDPARHGYDVEIDHFPEPGPYSDDVRHFPCPGCAAEVFSLVARFEYPDNVFEHGANHNGYVPAPEDLFTNFGLSGRCASCQAGTILSAVQCV